MRNWWCGDRDWPGSPNSSEASIAHRWPLHHVACARRQHPAAVYMTTLTQAEAILRGSRPAQIPQRPADGHRRARRFHRTRRASPELTNEQQICRAASPARAHRHVITANAGMPPLAGPFGAAVVALPEGRCGFIDFTALADVRPCSLSRADLRRPVGAGERISWSVTFLARPDRCRSARGAQARGAASGQREKHRDPRQ